MSLVSFLQCNYMYHKRYIGHLGLYGILYWVINENKWWSYMIHGALKDIGKWPNRTPSLKMVHIWMLSKVKCTLVYIAIHQATQCHQQYCSMLCSFWDIVTSLKMADAKPENAKNGLFEIFFPYNIYTHTNFFL